MFFGQAENSIIDEDGTLTENIIQDILDGLSCNVKIISLYNHAGLK